MNPYILLFERYSEWKNIDKNNMDVQLLLCFDDCPKIIIFFMKLDVHILRGCGLKSYDSGVPGSFVILDVYDGGGVRGGD